MSEEGSENDAMVKPLCAVTQVKNSLPEYHTRLQRNHFKEKRSNLARLQPALLIVSDCDVSVLFHLLFMLLFKACWTSQVVKFKFSSTNLTMNMI